MDNKTYFVFALVWILSFISLMHLNEIHGHSEDYKNCMTTERMCINSLQINYYEFNNSDGKVLKFQKNKPICILADVNNLSDYVVQEKSFFETEKECYVGSIQPCYKYSIGDKEPVLSKDCREYDGRFEYTTLLLITITTIPFGLMLCQTPS